MWTSQFHEQLKFFLFVVLQNKTNQIVPEFAVELKGATIGWASKDKSSKKNVLEVRFFVDTENIVKCNL